MDKIFRFGRRKTKGYPQKAKVCIFAHLMLRHDRKVNLFQECRSAIAETQRGKENREKFGVERNLSLCFPVKPLTTESMA